MGENTKLFLTREILHLRIVTSNQTRFQITAGIKYILEKLNLFTFWSYFPFRTVASMRLQTYIFIYMCGNIHIFCIWFTTYNSFLTSSHYLFSLFIVQSKKKIKLELEEAPVWQTWGKCDTPGKHTFDSHANNVIFILWQTAPKRLFCMCLWLVTAFY